MKAILQVADTGPLESLVVMLRSVNWECFLPDSRLRDKLRSLGCDTVLDIDHLVSGMGYERPMALPLAGVSHMERNDVVYVDIKAHRNGPRIWKTWPHLEYRTLWYRINGCAPEHVVNNRGDHGDERNPPCPILTPNLWYREEGPDKPWSNRAYAVWPPFYRWNEYFDVHGRPESTYNNPICLIHNLEGWGYGRMIKPLRDLGVKCYGDRSPDGLIPHKSVPKALSTSLAMVHLKSSDAPGYALYEALAAGCPLIVSRRLIWRNRMEGLFMPEETCLVFDRETHDALSAEDVQRCTQEIKDGLYRLSYPSENQRIGNAGRERLKHLMWSDKQSWNVESLRVFLNRMFRTS